MSKAWYNSPIGTIEITGTPSGISGLYFIPEKPTVKSIPEYLQPCINQLDEYFSGSRKAFQLELDPDGTNFQKAVWQELTRIPYGKTITYLDIAMALGDKNATRAVGNANSRNRISIIIPCHRVIGRDGKLTGYAGGLHRKRWLLEFENNGIQGYLFN